MEALAEEYIENIFACEKISPLEHRVQASSSPIPRIRIRSIDGMGQFFPMFSSL